MAAMCGCAQRRSAVIEIEADTPGDLLRIAWHLGNRHLPVQAVEGRLRIRDDHVIAAMVEGLGGTARPAAGAVRSGDRRLCRRRARYVRMGMTTKAGTPGLYRLLAWASPAFPTGAFSYSHGLEAAVAEGAVHDRATLERWIAAVVVKGSGRIDADILRDAYRAAAGRDDAALADDQSAGRRLSGDERTGAGVRAAGHGVSGGVRGGLVALAAVLARCATGCPSPHAGEGHMHQP